MQSFHLIQETLLIYCLSWRDKLPEHYPINIKKEINIVLTLAWTCHALFGLSDFGDLDWHDCCFDSGSQQWHQPSSPVITFVRNWGSYLSSSYKSQQTFTCLFFCSSVRRRGTNFATTRFIIKSSIKMHWHELRDTPFISEFSSMVRRRFARTAWWTFSTFSSVLLMEGWPQLHWFSTDISPLLKQTDHSYTCGVLITSSLNLPWALWHISAAVFPKRKQNFTHTHSLSSAI